MSWIANVWLLKFRMMILFRNTVIVMFSKASKKFYLHIITRKNFLLKIYYMKIKIRHWNTDYWCIYSWLNLAFVFFWLNLFCINKVSYYFEFLKNFSWCVILFCNWYDYGCRISIFFVIDINKTSKLWLFSFFKYHWYLEYFLSGTLW